MSFRPNMPHAAVVAIAILVCFSRGEARTGKREPSHAAA